jgi:cobalamin biosynthesis protein CobD/CbiB
MTEQLVDHPAPSARATREPLDPELERRVAAIESGAEAGTDFDAASWFWMVMLGVVGPLALLLWGWFGR